MKSEFTSFDLYHIDRDRTNVLIDITRKRVDRYLSQLDRYVIMFRIPTPA